MSDLTIDPWALILPPHIYVKFIEGLHPHVDKTTVIQEVTHGMTIAERKTVLARAKNMMATAKTVVDAISGAE